jgi:hypothetical protein
VRWLSEGKLCARSTNRFDFALLTVFAATLIFLGIFGEEEGQRDYRELL